MISLNKLFQRLDTPQKIQDYLDRIPFNFEEEGESYNSPKEVVRIKRMHCFEGALFALAALSFHKQEAWLLDLKTNDLKNDADHAVCLFKHEKKWGAISKTNHAVLRYRDPIYPSVETLAYSYFHEYFLNNGVKTLYSYSKPYNVLKVFGEDWINSSEELDAIALALDKARHYTFYSGDLKTILRKASKIERTAASLEEFNSHTNT